MVGAGLSIMSTVFGHPHRYSQRRGRIGIDREHEHRISAFGDGAAGVDGYRRSRGGAAASPPPPPAAAAAAAAATAAAVAAAAVAAAATAATAAAVATTAVATASVATASTIAAAATAAAAAAAIDGWDVIAGEAQLYGGTIHYPVHLREVPVELRGASHRIGEIQSQRPDVQRQAIGIRERLVEIDVDIAGERVVQNVLTR